MFLSPNEDNHGGGENWFLVSKEERLHLFSCISNYFKFKKDQLMVIMLNKYLHPMTILKIRPCSFYTILKDCLNILTSCHPGFFSRHSYSLYYPSSFSLFLMQIKNWRMSLTSLPSLWLGMGPSLKKWQWRNRRTTQNSPFSLVENTSATTSASLLWSSSSVCS